MTYKRPEPSATPEAMARLPRRLAADLNRFQYNHGVNLSCYLTKGTQGGTLAQGLIPGVRWVWVHDDPHCELWTESLVVNPW